MSGAGFFWGVVGGEEEVFGGGLGSLTGGACSASPLRRHGLIADDVWKLCAPAKKYLAQVLDNLT
ncbi:MAG: hypothetical protein Q8K92_13315 [Leadbetterella sp.]|nr:hypothetical protein [Leadbetterella sp.]